MIKPFQTLVVLRLDKQTSSEDRWNSINSLLLLNCEQILERGMAQYNDSVVDAEKNTMENSVTRTRPYKSPESGRQSQSLLFLPAQCLPGKARMVTNSSGFHGLGLGWRIQSFQRLPSRWHSQNVITSTL